MFLYDASKWVFVDSRPKITKIQIYSLDILKITYLNTLILDSLGPSVIHINKIVK